MKIGKDIEGNVIITLDNAFFIETVEDMIGNDIEGECEINDIVKLKEYFIDQIVNNPDETIVNMTNTILLEAYENAEGFITNFDVEEE